MVIARGYTDAGRGRPRRVFPDAGKGAQKMPLKREHETLRCVSRVQRSVGLPGSHRPTTADRTSFSSSGGACRQAAHAARAACFSLCSDPRLRRPRVAAFLRAFTLIEVLVSVGVIGVLLGILAPALHGARHAALETKGGAQTREIGVASIAYMRDHDRRLPQLRVTPNGEVTRASSGLYLPWLFGGWRSVVDVFNASSVGADQRPLNAYLGDFAPDDQPEVFRDPLDGGTNDGQLTGFAPDNPAAPVHELVGTSYVLNDHALDEVPCPFVEIYGTLVPEGGGRAPTVSSPARTWLAGQSPIYNYDDGEDKGELWGRDRVRASLSFVDGHVKVAVPVAIGAVNTTEDYTFFPQENWPDRFDHLNID